MDRLLCDSDGGACAVDFPCSGHVRQKKLFSLERDLHGPREQIAQGSRETAAQFRACRTRHALRALPLLLHAFGLLRPASFRRNSYSARNGFARSSLPVQPFASPTVCVGGGTASRSSRSFLKSSPCNGCTFAAIANGVIQKRRRVSTCLRQRCRSHPPYGVLGCIKRK
jgi:hypothetical protein